MFFKPIKFFLAGSIFSAQFCIAENGWDLIKKNDYKGAKEIFIKTLEKDSTDIPAIKGMIFLSETNGDDLSYGKYARKLVNTGWDENYFFLFEEQFSAKADKILEQKSLSTRAKKSWHAFATRHRMLPAFPRAGSAANRCSSPARPSRT